MVRQPVGAASAALLAMMLAAGCTRAPATDGQAPAAAAGIATPRYELVCDSSDTVKRSKLFCVRHDTRTGDVRRVAIDKLPRSNGPTRAAAGPSGRYRLVCDATSTATRSEFFCIRLNTHTGELLMVGLPKVGVVPKD